MFVSSVWTTRGLYCVCKASRNWEAERTQERALAAFFRKKKSDCRLILDFLEECWLKRSKEWKIERSKDRSIKTKTSKWKVGTVRVMKGSKDRKIEGSKDRRIERSIHQRKRKEKENEVTEKQNTNLLLLRSNDAEMMILKTQKPKRVGSRSFEKIWVLTFVRTFGSHCATFYDIISLSSTFAMRPSMTSSHIFSAMEECPNEGCWRQVVEWREAARSRTSSFRPPLMRFVSPRCQVGAVEVREQR